jgi:hypothetical protein
MNPYSPPSPSAQPYAAMTPPPGMSPLGGPAVSDLAVELLRQTRPWILFLAILALLGCVGMFLMGALMIGVGLIGPGHSSTGGVQVAMGAVYLPMGGLYLYPAIKMLGFAGAIARLTASHAMPDLEDALKHQKSFWKFSGIAAIAIIGLYIVVIIAAVGYGVASTMGKI